MTLTQEMQDWLYFINIMGSDDRAWDTHTKQGE